jgi:hypothetical protein
MLARIVIALCEAERVLVAWLTSVAQCQSTDRYVSDWYRLAFVSSQSASLSTTAVAKWFAGSEASERICPDEFTRRPSASVFTAW